MRGDQCTGRVDHAVNTPTPIHTYTHAHTQMWHCSDTQVCSMFPRTVSWADGLCVSPSVPVFRYVYVRVCLTLTVKLILLPNSDWETRGHYRTIQIHMVTQTHTYTRTRLTFFTLCNMSDRHTVGFLTFFYTVYKHGLNHKVALFPHPFAQWKRESKKASVHSCVSACMCVCVCSRLLQCCSTGLTLLFNWHWCLLWRISPGITGSYI